MLGRIALNLTKDFLLFGASAWRECLARVLGASACPHWKVFPFFPWVASWIDASFYTPSRWHISDLIWRDSLSFRIHISLLWCQVRTFTFRLIDEFTQAWYNNDLLQAKLRLQMELEKMKSKQQKDQESHDRELDEMREATARKVRTHLYCF